MGTKLNERGSVLSRDSLHMQGERKNVTNEILSYDEVNFRIAIFLEGLYCRTS